MRLARSPLSTRVDRLARSIGDLQDIVRGAEGEGRGAEGHGTAYRHQHSCRQVLPGYARGIRGVRDQPRCERQAEGIAKAKAAGVYRGRKPSVDAVEVRRLEAEGFGASQIAKQLKIGRASVYRVLEA